MQYSVEEVAIPTSSTTDSAASRLEGVGRVSLQPRPREDRVHRSDAQNQTLRRIQREFVANNEHGLHEFRFEFGGLEEMRQQIGRSNG